MFPRAFFPGNAFLEVIPVHTPIVALIYDFDKTLSPKDMQEYSFIPGLGMEPDAFWGCAASFPCARTWTAYSPTCT